MGAKKIKSKNQLMTLESLVTQQQLSEARAEQARTGDNLGKALVRLGYLEAHKSAEFLANQHNMPTVDLSLFQISNETAALVPLSFCEKNGVVPVQKAGNYLVLAIEDPDQAGFVKSNLKLKTGLQVEFVVATEVDLKEAILRAYSHVTSERLHDMIHEFDQAAAQEEKQRSQAKKIDIEEADKGYDIGQKSSDPLINFTHAVLKDAITSEVSDIHIESYEDRTRLRFRKDGVLVEKHELSKRMLEALTNRLKIMAQMDISERRKPQDGAIKVMDEKNGIAVDFRVNSVPTIFGEKIVLRILDKSNLKVNLTDIGMENFQIELLHRHLHRAQGMILLTGPTGSGKTTTIYSSLMELNVPEKNIMTAEDPVEYNLDGINQVQVNSAIEFNFPHALRSFLRQDPEVIMVGEVRDEETAGICYKAAATGHMVISTLHTNDSISTVTRLIAMGQPTYTVAENTSLVIAQRLVKTVCLKCKQRVKASPQELKALGVKEDEVAEYTHVVEGLGCQKCSDTGLSGREAVFEVLEITPALRDAINAKATNSEMKKIAMKNGFMTLRQHALLKLKQGRIPIKEVANSTVADNVEVL